MMKGKERLSDQHSRQVLLFVPNIIGYLRLLLLLAASVLAGFGSSSSAALVLGFISYATSQLLDIADGIAARRLKQVSAFGACLDQVLDRLSTCLLYLLNSAVYPHYTGVFFCCLLIDVGGHWLHFFASTAAGAASHKRVDDAPALLQIYYTSKVLMFLCIIFYEGFFLCLLAAYAAQHTFLHPLAIICAIFCLPLAAFKVVTNILQGLYGAHRLASLAVPNVSN